MKVNFFEDGFFENGGFSGNLLIALQCSFYLLGDWFNEQLIA